MELKISHTHIIEVMGEGRGVDAIKIGPIVIVVVGGKAILRRLV
jgi:hypothetical protein